MSEREYIRGFLRLPDSADSGRLRLLEDVPRFLAGPSDVLDPIELTVLDGSAGTSACALNSFVTSHKLSMPTPPAFPMELLVNDVLIGSEDPAEQFEKALLRCEDLLQFFGTSELDAVNAVGAGPKTVTRAETNVDGHSTSLRESVQVDYEDSSVSLRWRGEIAMAGAARPLREWGQALVECLYLFGFLLDRPLEFQLYRQRHTLSDQALLLLRCLELYHAHASRFESVVRARADHREIVRKVIDVLPDELRDDHASWIKGSLSESNRKRLGAQIEEVLSDLGADVLEACRIARAPGFAATARKVRNHYTHPTGPPPSGIPQGRELFIFVQRLWFAIRACLLVELGFSRQDAANALRRSATKHYLLA